MVQNNSWKDLYNKRLTKEELLKLKIAGFIAVFDQDEVFQRFYHPGLGVEYGKIAGTEGYEFNDNEIKLFLNADDETLLKFKAHSQYVQNLMYFGIFVEKYKNSDKLTYRIIAYKNLKDYNNRNVLLTRRFFNKNLIEKFVKYKWNYTLDQPYGKILRY